MSTPVREGTGTPLDRVPGVKGTDVEVVRWASPAGGGECTIVWLPTDRLDTVVANTGITAVERGRAAGYHRDSDRLLSLGSAWLMRQVLAPLLDVAPLEVPITRRCPQCARPHGRPVVDASTSEGATIEASATHSRGLVGVAVSTSGAIGIDVENLKGRGPAAWPVVWRALGRPPASAGPESMPGDKLPHEPCDGPVDDPESQPVAALLTGSGYRQVTKPETRQVTGLENELEAVRIAARTWVRTEAVLKATGHGLGVSPRSVRVTTGDAPRVTRWPWGEPDGHVSLFDLSPDGPYAGALAVIHPGNA